MNRPVYCWNCGAQNPSNSQFCDQCSAPLATPGMLGGTVRPPAGGNGAGAPPVSMSPGPPAPPVSVPAAPPAPAAPTPLPAEATAETAAGPVPPSGATAEAAAGPLSPPGAADDAPAATAALTPGAAAPVRPPRVSPLAPAAPPAGRRSMTPVLVAGALLALGLFLGGGLALLLTAPPGGAATATPTGAAAAATPNGLSGEADATSTLTNDQTGGVAAVPTSPAVGCAVFPSDNIWNRNIAALPTDPRSDQYIAAIGADVGLHRDFGAGLYEGAPLGIPYTTVSGTQPRIAVHFDPEASDESDAGPYPIPTNAPLEGGTGTDAEGHALVIDQGACVLYEIYKGTPHADGSWDAYAGAHWQLNSNALRPDSWTSADAAGLPIFPGLVRYDEVAGGAIHHALRFTAPQTQKAHIWPARHDAGDSSDPNLPPMGLRVRLKADYDISGFPPPVRVILQALKDYGMFLADNGSPWYIQGTPDDRWNNDLIQDNLKQVQGSDFEVIDESGLMIDPNSGQSR
jgi:hypothetical protein